MCKWHHMTSADNDRCPAKASEKYDLELFSHKQMTRFENVNYPHSRKSAYRWKPPRYTRAFQQTSHENRITTFNCKLTTSIMGSLFSSTTKKFGLLYSTLFTVVTQTWNKSGSRDTRSHAGVISGCSVYGLFSFKRVGLNAAHSKYHAVVVRLQKLLNRPFHRTFSPTKYL
jgi:hypothetical protein